MKENENEEEDEEVNEDQNEDQNDDENEDQNEDEYEEEDDDEKEDEEEEDEDEENEDEEDNDKEDEDDEDNDDEEVNEDEENEEQYCELIPILPNSSEDTLKKSKNMNIPKHNANSEYLLDKNLYDLKTFKNLNAAKKNYADSIIDNMDLTENVKNIFKEFLYYYINKKDPNYQLKLYKQIEPDIEKYKKNHVICSIIDFRNLNSDLQYLRNPKGDFHVLSNEEYENREKKKKEKQQKKKDKLQKKIKKEQDKIKKERIKELEKQEKMKYEKQEQEKVYLEKKELQEKHEQSQKQKEKEIKDRRNKLLSLRH